MKKAIITIVVLIVLFAAFAIINNHLPPSPGNAITFAEKKISSMMKDPDSVKFESSKFYQRGDSSGGVLTGYVCGYVNGKNSFGAYSGRQSFIVNLSVSDNGRTAFYREYYVDSMRPTTFVRDWIEKCK
ncbi:TPA: hypothetical protein ROG05_000126 [Enterobacter soli]|nr:hypothetical protein [Enterobacter soli]HDX4047787.1 hypothetical protein [Enterobacter soli]